MVYSINSRKIFIEYNQIVKQIYYRHPKLPSEASTGFVSITLG